MTEKLLRNIVLFACLCGILSMCTPNASDGFESASVFFPRQSAGNGYPQALLEGRLMEKDGCLYIHYALNNIDYLGIWPAGFKAIERDGKIEIMDGSNKVVFAVGDEIQVGGGETKTLENLKIVSDEVREEIEVRCLGPYWLVGEIVDP